VPCALVCGLWHGDSARSPAGRVQWAARAPESPVIGGGLPLNQW